MTTGCEGRPVSARRRERPARRDRCVESAAAGVAPGCRNCTGSWTVTPTGAPSRRAGAKCSSRDPVTAAESSALTVAESSVGFSLDSTTRVDSG